MKEMDFIEKYIFPDDVREIRARIFPRYRDRDSQRDEIRRRNLPRERFSYSRFDMIKGRPSRTVDLDGGRATRSEGRVEGGRGRGD